MQLVLTFFRMYAQYGKFPIPKFQTKPTPDTQVDTSKLASPANKTQVLRSKTDTGPRNFLIVPKLQRPKSVLIPSRKEVRFSFTLFFFITLSNISLAFS